MSGPAGGVQGVADVVTRNTPYQNLITFDMGGTSTDRPSIPRPSTNLTVELEARDLLLEGGPWRELLQAKFDQLHEQQFKYCLPNFELELMRLEVVSVDASPGIDIPQLAKAESTEPPADALVSKNQIVVKGQTMEAALWDREKISRQGVRVDGPCIITEMDSNTLTLPACYGEIDSIGNILIRPSEEAPKEQSKDETPEAALEIVQSTPLIPTLVSSALASICSEMDTLMLRCSMSPAIREQQDEFNVITTAEGKMLVGQFVSFITQFLRAWKGTIEEGDVVITNDTYMIEGAVTHLNDVIVLLPIFYEQRLIGWASQFGHLTDVGGIVPGSMSINASSIFDDVVQIPCIKLYTKGAMNTDVVDLLCRNSRQPDWYRSDLMAIITAFRTASSLSLLLRNCTAMVKIIESDFDDEPSTFTDFDRRQPAAFRLEWHLSESDHSINFYLSETMFRMFIGYYMIASVAPGTVINDGFHDLIDIHIPQGLILKPV
ncbi:Hydantoinase B/oxoprolinase-domain-containing protein [Aspergillus fruticulosus]